MDLDAKAENDDFVVLQASQQSDKYTGGKPTNTKTR